MSGCQEGVGCPSGFAGMFFCRTTFISRFCATSTVVSSRTALPAPSARRTFCQEGSSDDGHRHRQPVGFLAHREVCGRLQKTVWRATFGDASPHPHVRPVTRYQIKLVGRPGLDSADGSDMWSGPGIAGHRPTRWRRRNAAPEGREQPGTTGLKVRDGEGHEEAPRSAGF